ncbi:MAG: hypothetical protein COX80_04105 [Candidatus Magasanikbacteria bacterium CG_4_10_14_0_2_um_filter_33_14]|uniref:SH3b domain-containing protein n=1 Tax=Candidatus Magasanikbacteria bacterium CG_4_10_14_0_2_um_filter_33_14 TaxID=1974636 RepID=A0A2M7V9L4_9BACT|nr:MAG: hypothetical protein COX80_04105 [Candidatus Magasanikbacteria bacterium CG_4_10_14_0_2_um_filter_33_14]
MFRNKFFIASFACVFALIPSISQAESIAPEGYLPIGWVGGEGVQSYMRIPEFAGYIDYITTIDLTKNKIKLMGVPSSRVEGGDAVQPFETSDTTKNWLFSRSVVENLKSENPEVKFLWDAPFFNVTLATSSLSMGLKSEDSEGFYISSGSRPEFDMEQPRRMLIVDNKTGLARIEDFDVDIFVSVGDQAVEGFDPMGSPSSKSEQASRTFLGVKNAGKELVVYCSNSASREEASEALVIAGVPVTSQIQVDGGGSSTCAYNLPGQYFVEPGRALTHIMGVVPILDKGIITINNLNVRMGPGTNNSVVRTLVINTEVTIYEEKDGWSRISDSEWVYNKYVKIVKKVPCSSKATINNLNVRSGIGISNAVTRKLKLNEEVTVYEEKDGWSRISDSEWVFGSYLK